MILRKSSVSCFLGGRNLMNLLGLFRPNLSFITVTMKNSFCMYWAGRTRLELLSTTLTSQCFSSSTDSTCRLQKTKLQSSSYAASASTCHRSSSPTGQWAPSRITSVLTCQSSYWPANGEDRECSSNVFSCFLTTLFFQSLKKMDSCTEHYAFWNLFILDFFFNHLYLRT